MAILKLMLKEFAWDDEYRVANTDTALTPALVLYPEIVASNVERTIALLNGDGSRWRVHVKTAKLGYTMRMLVERGAVNFKCATTLELLMACESGAKDVLVAYPVMGANARRIWEIAELFPKVRISVLAENAEQVMQWRGSSMGVFLDINPGMNRTGIEQGRGDEIVKMVQAIRETKLDFRGLHYYDGHYGGLDEGERTAFAHTGYDRLLAIVEELEKNGIAVEEVITAGTPTFPCSLSYAGFRREKFVHRVSPGTVVYNDATSLAQLPREYGYKPAVMVATRVISHPRAGIISCDAGHKAVSADAGVPTCIVAGHSELTPLPPSEEHLPMDVVGGGVGPKVGEVLYLLPRHVCPTVNNFDYALLVRRNQVEAVERVSARGREIPIAQSKLKVLEHAAKS